MKYDILRRETVGAPMSSDNNFGCYSDFIDIMSKAYKLLNIIANKAIKHERVILTERRMEVWSISGTSFLNMYALANTNNDRIYWRIIMEFSEGSCKITPEVFKDYKYGEYPLRFIDEIMTSTRSQIVDGLELSCSFLLDSLSILNDQ